jgi:hypothetical protein
MTERVITGADGRKYITTEPLLNQGPDYERGFIDGMQKQMQSSVDKAVNAMAQPAPVQEPVAWEDGPHLVVRSDMRERLNYKGPWVDMGRAIPDAWVPVLYTTPPAQPAVPDAFGTREGEHPQYVQGWNDCRAEMLAEMSRGRKP